MLKWAIRRVIVAMARGYLNALATVAGIIALAIRVSETYRLCSVKRALNAEKKPASG
ncbi:MAG: hypothetical protein ACRCYL_19430 [Kluyvera sp.]